MELVNNTVFTEVYDTAWNDAWNSINTTTHQQTWMLIYDRTTGSFGRQAWDQVGLIINQEL